MENKFFMCGLFSKILTVLFFVCGTLFATPCDNPVLIGEKVDSRTLSFADAKRDSLLCLAFVAKDTGAYIVNIKTDKSSSDANFKFNVNLYLNAYNEGRSRNSEESRHRCANFVNRDYDGEMSQYFNGSTSHQLWSDFRVLKEENYSETPGSEYVDSVYVFEKDTLYYKLYFKSSVYFEMYKEETIKISYNYEKETKLHNVKFKSSNNACRVLNPSINHFRNLFTVNAWDTLTCCVGVNLRINECALSLGFSDKLIDGIEQTLYGYSEKGSGYKPNGWKIIKGGNLVDSTDRTISFVPDSDIEVELQCEKTELLKVTSTPTVFYANRDYRDYIPESGLHFVYTAPDDGVYGISVVASDLCDKDENYKGTDIIGRYAISHLARDLCMKRTPRESVSYVTLKKGEEHDFWVYVDTEHLDSSVTVSAQRKAFVVAEGMPSVDTVVTFGDSVSLSAKVDSGYTFVKWALAYGKGVIRDSTSMKTVFVTASDSAKVRMVTKTAQTYKLTNKFSTYSFLSDGSQTKNYYGVRTVFEAKDSGQYIFVSENSKGYYVYPSVDSSFDAFGSGMNLALNGRFLFNADKGENRYFLLYSSNLSDSVKVKVLKTVKVNAEVADTSAGYVRVSNENGSFFYDYDSTRVAGDTISIRAYPSTGFRMDKWELVSGSCQILDTLSVLSKVVLNGDCRIRAHFKEGSVYEVTKTPESYTTANDYYLGSSFSGVRFSFVAPSDGKYAIVVSGLGNFMLTYYPSSQFASSSSYSYFLGTHVDTLRMAKNDSVFFIVQNRYYSDSSDVFWVNYSTGKGALTLVAESHGSVYPRSGYNPAWKNAKYYIEAKGDAGYRFAGWNVISGKAAVDDAYAPYTFATVDGKASISAQFRKGSIYSISTKKKTFNYNTHYYSENTGSAVYMTWTPPDSAWYVIQVEASDLKATLQDFGTDSLLNTFTSVGGNGSIQKSFKGTAGVPLYWSIEDSSSLIPNKSFSVRITVPYILRVSSSEKGRVNPNGEVALFPGADTVVSALSYGGYVFSKWEPVSGKMTIEDSSKTETRIKPLSEQCEVMATYMLDFTAVPSLTISSLDMSGYPGICAQVAVTDENSGKSIVGMTNSDFVLFEDQKALPIQVTTIQDISGVSVALVVDESGSMSGVEIQEAKNSIRRFIDEMGPFDRTAIVGFTGGSDAEVHQAMTSDKDLLYKAANGLSATGGTNINTGAKLGVEQVVGETNPSAVIIFSDGSNGSESVTYSQVVDLAKSLNTTIYSIGLGSNYKNPLLYLAEGTGGSYTYAPSASELAGIYSTIRSAVQARYVVCYQTPDTLLNGDKHEVVIKTNFLNKDASDTTYWDENSMPPVVTLTKKTKKLIGVEQPEGDSLEIKVYVSSADSIVSVLIYTRISSKSKSSDFSAQKMVHVKDSLWRYVVPASSVVSPGIDFYVVATDASGLIGKNPSVPTPSKEPYTIPVENKAPDIQAMQLTCIDTTDKQGMFAFDIYDKDNISSATLYYKNPGTVIFNEQKMTRLSKSEDVWTAAIPTSYFVSSSVEFYVRAVDRKGVSARWLPFENTVISACKGAITVDNVDDKITIVNGDAEDSPIVRQTEMIGLTLESEDFSYRRDTAKVTLSCLVSGDVESNVKLLETHSGHYELSKPMVKNEYTVKKDNGEISCNAIDILVAEYKDPLYGDYARDTVIIGKAATYEYRFLDADCESELDSVETSKSADFCLQVLSESPSLYVVDTLKVVLFTNKGDSLLVKAVESDVYSSEFLYAGRFDFVEEKASMRDSILDAAFDLEKSYNRIKIQGAVNSDRSSLKKRDSLVVYSRYSPADIAEIYDKNLDGRADFIRVHFKTPLERVVSGIDSVYWNVAGGESRRIDSDDIVISRDSQWVEAPIEEPFEYGLTFVGSSKMPYLKVTKTEADFSQKVVLADKIGAVPVKVEKRPGEITVAADMNALEDLPPDTLLVTLSEPIKKKKEKNAWKKLFQYALNCEEPEYHQVNLLEEPVVDETGLGWTLVLADYNVMVDYCFATNPEADYVDTNKNAMGRGGVHVTGLDGSVYLYDVSANPPVTGIGKVAKWINAKGEWETLPDTISSIRVESVAPYIANIIIYDELAHVVATMVQKFGFDGEMDDPIRANNENRAKLGFLTWNQRSDDNRKVGTGAYIWRIDFKFEDGHFEYRLLRTGVMRGKEKN